LFAKKFIAHKLTNRRAVCQREILPRIAARRKICDARSDMSKLRKWFLRAILAAAALFFLAIVAAILFPQQILCVDDGLVNADTIVVLGGGSGERPERAAELFKEHGAPQIILSGLGDCENNRRFLMKAGVPANVIQMENKSRTTRENAEFTIRLLRAENVHRAIIVTTWYHSRRALKCFQHFAPEIKFYSRPSYFADTRADWSRKVMAKRVYLEYLKLPGYWICYGICPF
jgi:uncharacterized SAM-binding protein YcdF (DUF218 family)